ncbi:ABC transporter ATP-binding protein [Georgenia sp. MJ206]|uniref:ABC transporter ATP-binding protein n=1 Tax=Georgenia wangjunii TaxID=3117730 RepID=UPI002F260170
MTTQARADGSTGAAAPLLRVRDLHVAYRGRSGLQEVVHGVDLDVHAGEVLAVVGESGSGKTTLAHAVIGLLPGNGAVTDGQILLRDRDITALAPRAMARVRGAQIGLVPQDPSMSLNPVHRVGHQVAEALRIHRLAGRTGAAERAVELLGLAGLPEPAVRAQQYPHQLSGGMRQRVLIAIALACEPPLVIADEPTSALDVTVQRTVLDRFADVTARSGTAVLFITHDLAVAADRADRIVVMRDGNVVETGVATEVLGAPEHPYTRQLLAAAPSMSSTRIQPRPRASSGGAPAAGSGAASAPATDPTAAGATATGPSVAVPSAGRAGATRPPGAAGSASAPVLEVRSLVKEFPLPDGGSSRVLRAVADVSFSIPAGQTFALVGESGSGKSTTARIAMMIERPTSGSVLLGGQDVTSVRGEPLRKLRAEMQIVYQNPYASLDPRFTVERIVAEPLRAFRVGTTAQRRARVRELLDQVALPSEAARRRPAELSGGQRQRVAIARALALRPRLLVLDEPVSALDVSVQAQILRLLVDLQSDLGLAYLFISHDLAVVRQVSDGIGVMRAGELLEVGEADDVFNRPEHEYTRELLAAIPGRRVAT